MVGVNWTNFTDFSKFPQLANEATSGSFWVGMLYMIWIILILVLIAYGFEVAIMVSSFLALVAGLLLVYADLVNWQYLLTFVGVLLSMFLYIIWSGSKVRQ